MTRAIFRRRYIRTIYERLRATAVYRDCRKGLGLPPKYPIRNVVTIVVTKSVDDFR